MAPPYRRSLLKYGDGDDLTYTIHIPRSCLLRNSDYQIGHQFATSAVVHRRRCFSPPPKGSPLSDTTGSLRQTSRQDDANETDPDNQMGYCMCSVRGSQGKVLGSVRHPGLKV